jgi:hypothetical protein
MIRTYVLFNGANYVKDRGYTIMAAYGVRTSRMPRSGEIVPPLLDKHLPHASASLIRYENRPFI